MRYAAARYDQKRRGDAYRVYISECLRIMTENTAKLSAAHGGEASYMEKRFGDVIAPGDAPGGQPEPGEPTRRIRKLFSDEE